MAKRIFAVMAAAVIALGAVAQTRIGTVNKDSVLRAMPEYAKAQTELQQAAEAYQKEYAAMQADFNTRYADFQSLRGDVPPTILERRIKELQEADTKLKEFRKTIDADLKARRDALQAPLVQAVDSAVAAVAAEQALELVLDVSQTPVAYAGATVVDITAAVNDRLR